MRHARHTEIRQVSHASISSTPGVQTFLTKRTSFPTETISAASSTTKLEVLLDLPLVPRLFR